MKRLRLGSWFDIYQQVFFGQNFLGMPGRFLSTPVWENSSRPFATPFRSDVSPVSRRAKLFANHGTLRFALNVYCKFRKTFAVTVCDLAQIPDTCAASFCEQSLLRDGQFI